MEFKTKFETPWAFSDTLLMLKTGDWRYQKPVVAVDRCSQCGVCYLFCPTGCVQEMGDHYQANLEYCKGCGICAKLCPVNAIEMVREE